MKKAVSVLLAFLVIAAALPFGVSAAQPQLNSIFTKETPPHEMCSGVLR